MLQTPFLRWSDRLDAGIGVLMIRLEQQARRRRPLFRRSGFQNLSLLKLLVWARNLHLGWLSPGSFFGARHWNRALLPLRFPKYSKLCLRVPFNVARLAGRYFSQFVDTSAEHPAPQGRTSRINQETIQLIENNETES